MGNQGGSWCCDLVRPWAKGGALALDTWRYEPGTLTGCVCGGRGPINPLPSFSLPSRVLLPAELGVRGC